MPQERRPLGSDQALERMRRDIDKLQKQLSQVIDSRRVPFVISFAGPPEEDLPSPPWRPIHPTEIDLIVPQVGLAPSGADMTIDLSLNASVVRTLTIPDGQFYVEDAVPFVIPMGYVLTATVTAASAAEDLAIHFIPKLV